MGNLSRRLLAAIVASAFALGTAQAKKPLELPMPVGEKLSIEVVPAAREIQVDVPDTSAMGAQFGLIGAIISSSMDNAAAKKAEARMAPVRDKLIDVDFQRSLEAALRERLPGSGIATTPQFHFLTGVEQVGDPASVRGRPLRAMVLTPRYAFDAGMTRMYVKLTASLVERTLKSNGKYKTRGLFSRDYVHGLALQGTGDVEQNQARWLAMPAPALVELLNAGLDQSVAMLLHDFSQQGRAEWNHVPTKAERHGRIVRQEGGVTWTRLGKGIFQSLQGSASVAPVAPDAAPVVPAEAGPAPPVAASSAAGAP